MDASETENRHRAVWVEVGPWKAEIDEGLAPLITAIWEAGINTVMCCQEAWPGIAWIKFWPEELAEFLNLITSEFGHDGLWERIHSLESDSLPGWEYFGDVFDYNCDTDERPEFGPVGISIYFPTSDIPLLVDRLAPCRSESCERDPEAVG